MGPVLPDATSCAYATSLARLLGNLDTKSLIGIDVVPLLSLARPIDRRFVTFVLKAVAGIAKSLNPDSDETCSECEDGLFGGLDSLEEGVDPIRVLEAGG